MSELAEQPLPSAPSEAGAAAPLGMVSLRSGSTPVIYPTRAQTRVQPTAIPSGVIYTSAEDRPSLEALLERHEVAFAVIEPSPTRQAPAPVRTPQRKEKQRVSNTKGFIAAAGIGIATSAAGWVLFVDAVAGSSVQANPYTALLLALGGLIILLSVLLAIHEPND